MSVNIRSTFVVSYIFEGKELIILELETYDISADLHLFSSLMWQLRSRA